MMRFRLRPTSAASQRCSDSPSTMTNSLDDVTYVVEMTNALDKVTHLVGPIDHASAIASRQPSYRALCGRVIFSASLAEPPGSSCPGCRDRVGRPPHSGQAR